MHYMQYIQNMFKCQRDYFYKSTHYTFWTLVVIFRHVRNTHNINRKYFTRGIMRVHCITKSKLVQGLAFWTCLQMVIWLNPGEVIILLLLAVLHMFLQIISVMINISIIYFLLGTNLLFKQLKFCPHQIKVSYGCHVYNCWHMKHIFFHKL